MSEQVQPATSRDRSVALLFRDSWPAAVLVVLGLAVRLVGLRWGLPGPERWYPYHPDEPQTVVAVANLDFFSGQFNPHFFNYPSLYLYLTYCAHLLGSGLGLLRTPTQSDAVWLYPQNVLLAGRVVTACLGALTVGVVYRIGQLAGSRRVAIGSALLMALLPGHGQHSHFATVDVPATFFAALSLLLALWASSYEGGPSGKLLAWSAVAAGLAGATNYNAAIVIVAPLMVAWQSRGVRPLWKWAPAVLGLASLGFVIACPYSLLSFREFWGDGNTNGFAYELLAHPRLGHGDIFTNTGNGWWYHLTFNLPFVMTWPLLVAALSGLGLAMQQARRKPALLCMVVWAVLYFFAMGFSQVRFMRYTLLLTPVLCVLAACGLQQLAGSSRPKALIAFGLAGLFALIATCNVEAPFVMTDPRDAAADHVRSLNIKSVGLLNPPWFWTPPISPRDAPPGSGVAAADVEAAAGARYQFAYPLTAAGPWPQAAVMSDLEFRDKQRLANSSWRVTEEALISHYGRPTRFKNRPPWTLPGREFVPQDFLYNNPEVDVYQKSG